MAKLTKPPFRKTLYIILTILPSILTGTFYNNFTTEKLTTSTSTSIKSLGFSLNKQLEQLTSSIYYSLDLMTDSDDFQTLNIANISKSISLFNYYNANACSNIFIVDKDSNTLYGINDNLINNISYTDHIKMGFTGHPQTYYAATPKPFAQLVFPIFSHENSTEVIAVLVATFNMEIFDKVLSNISDINPNFSAFILGKTNGTVVASSLPTSANIPETINIEDVKMALKFSKNQTFVDYNGITMYGAVFPLPSIDSYLLLTVPDEDASINYMDYLSYILGLLGAGTITTTELVRKKRQSNSSIEDSPATDLLAALDSSQNDPPQS